MSTTSRCLMLLVSLVFRTTFANSGVDWFFDSYDKSPRAVLLTPEGDISHQMPLSAFTACFYVKMDDRLNREVVLLSYASHATGEANEVLFEVNNDKSYSALSINGEAAIFKVVPKRKEWVHICVSWTTVNGEVNYYLDGEKQSVADDSTKIVRPGYTIAGEGCLVMGQDQDEYNDKFDPEQGLTGGMTQVNVWDYVLSPAEVKQVQNCQLAGNIVNWGKGLWGFYDKVMERPSTAPCYVQCGQVHTS